ncbi:uncharacterized protein LOC116015592 isoform X2 [Ipomoea triloba]|uniref:uncharacterized protein LOC116015592 isoform X2 n=1 Tax=Ipomoea triloba TaxID=35885 RepID=UPI00125D76B5|nr:uncharacterized protein LOC116015592 isoform X2 [Ipomoea triloba]
MDITICAWDILLVKQGHGARRSFPYSMTISKVIIAIYRSGFKCKKCNKTYSSKNIYVDLTVTAGTKEFNEFKPARTELFSITGQRLVALPSIGVCLFPSCMREAGVKILTEAVFSVLMKRWVEEITLMVSRL